MTDAFDENRAPKWPSVEDATRRINVLIEGQVEGPEADMAARDLIVLMRENGKLREALEHCRHDAGNLLALIDAALRPKP